LNGSVYNKNIETNTNFHRWHFLIAYVINVSENIFKQLKFRF